MLIYTPDSARNRKTRQLMNKAPWSVTQKLMLAVCILSALALVIAI